MENKKDGIYPNMYSRYDEKPCGCAEDSVYGNVIAYGCKEHDKCEECDEPIANCECIDCGQAITKQQAEYDHFCEDCSFNNARR